VDDRAKEHAVDILIPEAFRSMPRWWSEGTEWLDALPDLVADQCQGWHLQICGEPAHGSNAIVFPVSQGADQFALRLTPPALDVVDEVQALAFWDGRGTVRLFDSDVDRGATLLELVSSRQSLNDVPVSEAMVQLGRMMRRLAVPGADCAPSTGSVAARRSAELETEWNEHGRPSTGPSCPRRFA
jgi:streptomycin 6-kinase